MNLKKNAETRRDSDLIRFIKFFVVLHDSERIYFIGVRQK